MADSNLLTALASETGDVFIVLIAEQRFVINVTTKKSPQTLAACLPLWERNSDFVHVSLQKSNCILQCMEANCADRVKVRHRMHYPCCRAH